MISSIIPEQIAGFGLNMHFSFIDSMSSTGIHQSVNAALLTNTALWHLYSSGCRKRLLYIQKNLASIKQKVYLYNR